MTLTDLKALVASGESGTLEFKESTGQKMPAAKTLCAFLNGHGGTVVFGVSRKGALIGQLVSDSTQRELAAEFVKFEPGYEFSLDYVAVDERHQAIVVSVPSGKAQPYQYDGRAYRRIESTTSVMPQSMYEVLLKERGGFRSAWETEIAETAGLKDLDCDLICETARMAVAYGRLDATADVTDPMRLLRKFGLAKNGRIFKGAMALFGGELTDYPQCYLRMARFVGTDKRDFLDSRNIVGNVFTLINEAVAFCFKHLNLRGTTTGRIKREEQLEIPVDAIREALVNALAHRDYSTPGGSVSIAVFDDRVEIRNPGHLPSEFPISAPETSDDSVPHNPIMARVLYLRKTIEMWGRGMGLIAKVCEGAGYPHPKISEENGSVRVIFARVSKPGRKRVRKSPNKSAVKSPGRSNGEAFAVANTGRRAVVPAAVKSPNKSDAKSPNNAGAKSPDKSAVSKRRVLAAVGRMLPSAMRADARRNLLAVFGEIFSDRFAPIADIEQRTGLANGTVKEMIAMLKEIGLIFRVGAKKNGHWMISEQLCAGR